MSGYPARQRHSTLRSEITRIVLHFPAIPDWLDGGTQGRNVACGCSVHRILILLALSQTLLAHEKTSNLRSYAAAPIQRVSLGTCCALWLSFSSALHERVVLLSSLKCIVARVNKAPLLWCCEVRRLCEEVFTVCNMTRRLPRSSSHPFKSSLLSCPLPLLPSRAVRQPLQGSAIALSSGRLCLYFRLPAI